jgi:hypothetical protein
MVCRMRHPCVFLLPVCMAVAAPARAQSEAALKDFFEGKSVRVKIDMPATQQGIDLYPDARRAINFDDYSARVKTSGISIRSGESVVVTRVRVKDKIIEFHLGGGGYGTFGDDTSGSAYTGSTPKSNREKDLEKLVKDERDAARKTQLQRELDDLRSGRQREDSRNQAASAAASEAKKTRIAESRLHSGSRFNIRYQDGVPPGLGPDGLMRALAEYVDFPFASGAAPSTPQVSRAGAIRKGMTLAEVETALGRPEKTTERSEGSLKVVTATYSRDDQRITAEFVEGVLIRYSIASR